MKVCSIVASSARGTLPDESSSRNVFETRSHLTSAILPKIFEPHFGLSRTSNRTTVLAQTIAFLTTTQNYPETLAVYLSLFS